MGFAGPGLGQRPAGVDSRCGLDDNFPRARAAEKVGLHSAFAVPVVRGSDVVGVMEFFSGDIREPDTALLDTMKTAASQIGLYAAGKWAMTNWTRSSTCRPICCASQARATSSG